jgi:phage tail tape-measure protein
MAEQKKQYGGAGAMGTGAMSGAQIGSAFGPIGTGIGAGIGALAGFLFGGRKPTQEELARLEALKEFGALPDIDWASTIPNLSSYQAQDIKDAILEGDRDKISSAFEQLPDEDPSLRSAKMQALGQLQRQGKEGFT